MAGEPHAAGRRTSAGGGLGPASPNLVVSHQMTWDFLYNLSGAWHLQHGHVPHVDFHEPVGQLNFVLTQLGFN